MALLDTGDYGDLNSLLAQFQPSEADKAAARKTAQLQFFLGMMGAPKGTEFQAIGQSGINAINNYQKQIQFEQALRNQNVTAAAQAYKLMKDAQMTQFGMNLANGAINAAPAPAASSPNPGAGASPGVTTAPAPAAQAPAGVPNWANPTMEFAFGVMGNPKVADIIHRQYQVTQGPGGTLIRNGQIVGQVIPNAGMVIDNKFQPLPPDATQALLNFNTQQKLGEAQAQASVNLTDYPIGNNQTQKMTQLDAARRAQADAAPGGQQPPPASPPNSPLVGMPANGNSYSPAQMAALNGARDQLRATEATGVYGVGGTGGGMGGPGVTANPLAMKAAEANIDTSAQQQRAFNAANVAAGQKTLEDLQSKKTLAVGALSGLDQLDRMDQQGVFNGPAQNKYMTAAIWLNSMFPSLNLDTSKITNSQAYDSALAQIQRSGLKAFGGRVTNAEFKSVGLSMPDRILTPQGRAQVRAQMGAMAMDELNQARSAEQYFNPQSGLNGWTPPPPIQPSQYMQARSQIMGLKPRANLTPQQQQAVATILQSGNEDAIRQVVTSGLAQ